MNKIYNIQALRGIAALLVVLSHLLIIEQKYGGTQTILSEMVRFGVFGVDLFFVISGFIMITISRNKFQSSKETLKFIYHRTTRIYPAYWFYSSLLLIVFALIDLIPFFNKLKFDSKSLSYGGFLSGFFGGLTGNQGALRSAFLIKIGLDKKVFIGTTVVISSLVDFTRLSVYTTNLYNLNLNDYSAVGFFAISSGVIGSYLGNKLLKKVTLKSIKILVAFMILFLAMALLIGLI